MGTTGLEYESVGKGESVLLIHGAIICDSDAPYMSQPALVGRHRVIRYHRRGYADSAPRPPQFGIRTV